MAVRTNRAGAGRSGFTLIELLVVIAIISLLISILLPSMSSARRTGQRVACMGALKEIAAGNNQYALDNGDWMVGSPGGSGAHLLAGGNASGSTVQIWDFMGPLAQMWQLGITELDGTPNAVKNRFNDLRNSRSFQCAANKFLAFRFGTGPDAGTGIMVSFNTGRYQLLQEGDGPDGITHINADTTAHEEKLPKGWRPSITRIGNSAHKVFVADGSRYATCNDVPDYDLAPTASWGGAFSDTGVHSSFSRSWDRGRAPGNIPEAGGEFDARFYAFRHSSADPPQGAPANAFKINLGFYDGHVETQGDLEASNPHYWLPQGTTLVPGGAHADTAAHFGLSGPVRIGP